MKTNTFFSHHRLIKFFAALFLSSLLVSLPAAAQEIVIAGVVISEDDTANQIDAAIAAVEAQQGLDEETQTAVLEQLREAAASLQRKINADVAAEQFAASLNTAPAQTDALRATLDAQAPDAETIKSLGIEDSVSLAELQQRLATGIELQAVLRRSDRSPAISYQQVDSGEIEVVLRLRLPHLELFHDGIADLRNCPLAVNQLINPSAYVVERVKVFHISNQEDHFKKLRNPLAFKRGDRDGNGFPTPVFRD